MSSKQELLRLIEADSEQHIALLQSLIRAPSPNPPGDIRQAIGVVQSFLGLVGITAKIIAPRKASPNLVSILRGENATPSSRSIVLNGHIDQFPVGDAEHWKREPYSGDIEEGFVHGRSGVDMKAVSDEETDGRWGTQYLLEDDGSEEWRRDCILIGEPSGLDSIRFGEKGTLRMTFTVTAQAAHGAYTHRSEGAIRIASRLIEELVDLEKLSDLGMDEEIQRYMQQPDVRKVADEIMWKGAADAMVIPTVNIGTIRGGDKINMIPSECVIEADIRIPIGVETQTILDKIDVTLKDFPTTSYLIHEHHSHISTHSQPDHEVVRLLQRNAEMLRRKMPVAICSLGATDCKHFRRHKIPAYAYGPHPRGMAERDEKVSIVEFLDTVKVHTLTAWDFLNGAG